MQITTPTLTGLRRWVRWALRHGLIRFTTKRGAKAGELSARLILERALIEDPYAAYEALRAKGRLVRSGAVLLAHDHDVCTEILRSQDFGVVGPNSVAPPGTEKLVRFAGPGPVGPIEPPALLVVNPPDHTRMRKLVTRAFTVKAVTRLRGRTEEIATELLDAMAAKPGPVDLMEDYASLLPATVIAEMMGAPVEMRRQFLEWGAQAALSLDFGLPYREFVESERGLQALEDWMRGHFAEIRRNPGQNILSDLVRAHDEAGALDDDELASIAVLLLAAGFETTVNLIGNAVALLTAHRDQLALLQSGQAQWSTAVDEALRMESPVQRTARLALRDTEVAGIPVPAGQVVITVLAAANRDPRVFADPARFDVTRANAGDHLAFSSGIHYCLGAGLARMEAEVGLQKLFERFPDLELAGRPRLRPTRTLRGFDAMPVRLTPARVEQPA
ncbi:cytochrome P450 [Pseudonocardia thermophila]|jgi:Cytochrome P450|uniref:cytochrome P450 n=1 Tax=Pseudonocardia thermophila TaxID=1848 RepID=UPI00248E0012|nr:cytochrome P450 [Pseudonocardia thermophila]